MVSCASETTGKLSSILSCTCLDTSYHGWSAAVPQRSHRAKKAFSIIFLKLHFLIKIFNDVLSCFLREKYDRNGFFFRRRIYSDHTLFRTASVARLYPRNFIHLVFSIHVFVAGQRRNRTQATAY